MLFRLQAVFVGSALLLLFALFELIRTRRLEERYALLWIFAGGTLLLVSLRTSLLTRLAEFFGVLVPANALFLFGLLFVMVLLLSLTVVLSSLSRKNGRLSQELSLLQFEVEELRAEIARQGDTKAQTSGEGSSKG